MVLSTQRAAQASLEWFENLGQYADQDPLQFAFNIMTRSRRVTYDNLRLRDPEFVARVDRWFAEHEATPAAPARSSADVPPMFQPFSLRGLELVNRVVVSPMDMYCAVDGLAERLPPGPPRRQGARRCRAGDDRDGLRLGPRAGSRPGCTGIWTDEQAAAWRRVTDFVHAESAAKIGIQLGHSGRKGSTKLMWEGIDQPLDDGNWEVVAPVAAALPRRVSTRCRASSTARTWPRSSSSSSTPPGAPTTPASTCSSCTARTATCSPPSSRPLTNRRADEYGGDADDPAALPARGVHRDARGLAGRTSR